MTEAQIKFRYAQLMHSVQNNDFYKIDLTNRVNCYQCQTCHHITKTKDVDSGVTPFMFRCEVCGEIAYSSFYKDCAPQQIPTFEWYRPSLDETLEKSNAADFDLEHVLRGGLIPRKI